MIKKLIAGFGYAIKGIIVALRTQRNMRIHFVAILVVTVTGILLDLMLPNGPLLL
jgi:diacylglycerol kinase (ATP)